MLPSVILSSESVTDSLSSFSIPPLAMGVTEGEDEEGIGGKSGLELVPPTRDVTGRGRGGGFEGEGERGRGLEGKRFGLLRFFFSGNVESVESATI